MAEKPLENPDLPPGAIVATHADDDALEEGQARRNDGIVLNPAAKNPWYVLATVAGEQVGDRSDPNLHAKNRRYWNGWMCRSMDRDKKEALAKKMELEPHDLAPLTESELERVKNKLAQEISDSSKLKFNRLSGLVDFRNTCFSKTVAMDRFFFGETAAFENCAFIGSTDFECGVFGHAFFQRAVFRKKANFESVDFQAPATFMGGEFVGNPYFNSCRFRGRAEFGSCVFHADGYFSKCNFEEVAHFAFSKFGAVADFTSSHFHDDALFAHINFEHAAIFRSSLFSEFTAFRASKLNGAAQFEDAKFAGPTDFANGEFNSTTTFQGAEFTMLVPEFFQCQMHQDTHFTTERAKWPTVTQENAEQGKKAYTRLRQIAAETHDPDLEHFFLRQEMRCKEAIEAGKRAWFYVFLFRLYRWVSDYGYSVAWPTAWLVFIWAFGAACFAGHFDNPASAGLDPDILNSRYWTAAGLSFGNLFGFLGINRLFFADFLKETRDALQFIAGAQTVAGVVLLFFLGLGLRNRFRLH